MRFLSKLFLLLVLITCLFSCASLGREKRLYTNITDDIRFFLLPPQNIEHNMDMAQYITAVFRGENYFLIAWVKACEESIEMAFFNELGASIGELFFDGNAIQFSSTVIPKAAMRYLKPEYIVADFQLCFFDHEILKETLESSGLVLEVQGDNRRILNGNEVIIEIIKTNSSVKLVNNLRGYAYAMEGDFSGL